MDMPTITPVLLCGGSGTRLWPLSRRSHPKQFAPLCGENSLFQQTARRLDFPGFAPPLVLTHADFRFMVAQQLLDAGVAPGAIFLEPVARNTAPAVLAAALWLARRRPEALMLIAPTDHLIEDPGAFRAAVARGSNAAREGRIVTFGIRPERARTGYGYLEIAPPEEQTCQGRATRAGGGPLKLRRFVEKPDEATARGMLTAGSFLWNAGIFLATADTIARAFRQHAPELIAPVEAALSTTRSDSDFVRLEGTAWKRVKSISLDYAIMEKATNIDVVPLAAGWSDLGDWDSVFEHGTPGPDGVALSGHATALDCRDSLLRSEDPGQEIVGIGLENIIAVAMPDAVLVADRRRAQDVKQAVELLQKKRAQQAGTFSREHRPWGWFDILQEGPGFKVKQITIHPGGCLSLQRHRQRAEHWIVVAGSVRATIGSNSETLHANQSVHVPLGTMHRLENSGNVPAVLIEVQTGSYLGEDDIIRYDDVYERA